MDKAQFPNNRRRAIAPLTAAAVRHRDTVIYVNPGSAGPRRFSLLISVGELMVDEDGGISARTVELVVPKRI